MNRRAQIRLMLYGGDSGSRKVEAFGMRRPVFRRIVSSRAITKGWAADINGAANLRTTSKSWRGDQRLMENNRYSEAQLRNCRCWAQMARLIVRRPRQTISDKAKPIAR